MRMQQGGRVDGIGSDQGSMLNEQTVVRRGIPPPEISVATNNSECGSSGLVGFCDTYACFANSHLPGCEYVNSKNTLVS